MDVHSGFYGTSQAELEAAHAGDLAIQAEEGVSFDKAWLDPVSGKAFCISTGPSKEAVQRIHARNGIPTEEIYEIQSEV
jgi:hypothetical protein